jgi:hypothetical protein
VSSFKRKVCVQCGDPMRIKRNGYLLVKPMPDGTMIPIKELGPRKPFCGHDCFILYKAELALQGLMAHAIFDRWDVASSSAPPSLPSLPAVRELVSE